MRSQSLIILLLAALIALPTGAASAATYKVRKGDSLDRIAKKRHVTVEALREANALEGDALKPGMRLTIPEKGGRAKASDDSTAAAPESGTPAVATTAHVTEWAGYHTVRKGDSLESVAESAGLTVAELKKLNPGKSARRLKAGTRLRVLSASGAPATAPATAAAPRAPESAPGPAAAESAGRADDAAPSHVVRKGDTFKTIAKANGLGVNELKALNPGKDSRRLKIGMRLNVRPAATDASPAPVVASKAAAPVAVAPKAAPPAAVVAKAAAAAESPQPASDSGPARHSVRKGDTFATIAKANGLTVDELKELNPGKDSRRLKIGMKLNVRPAATDAAPAPVVASKAAAAVAKAAAAAESPQPAADSGPARHSVRKGDTFKTIAKANGLTVDELKALNPGKDSRRLKIGMKLNVRPASTDAAPAPVAASKAAAPVATVAKAAAASEKTQSAADSGPARHTVRKGETFATIAKANGLTVNELKALNPGKNTRRLKIGMPLRVRSGAELAQASEPAPVAKAEAVDPAAAAAKPVYHKVRKGESFASIASTYGVSVKALKKLNNVRKAKKLKPGSRLLVRRGESGGAATVTADRRRELEQILRNEGSLTAEGAALAAAQVSEMAPDLLAAGGDNAIAGPIAEENLSPGVTDRVIRVAKLMLDLPYRFGGTSLTGIDCSGYVQKVFGFLNLPLPRTAREQFARGKKIEKQELATGDLVFFQTYARFPSHVGIYLGDNKFIHASSGDRKVKIDSLDTPYFLRRYIGARRLVHDRKDSEE